LRPVVVVDTFATAVGTPKMPVLGNITACTYPDSFFVPIKLVYSNNSAIVL
jgi:hypothetical protein